MKINKYSLSKNGTTIGAFVSSSSSTNISSSTISERNLWGNDDEGGDIDSTLFVNGSLYLKVPDYSDEENGDNEGEKEDQFTPESDDEGGNIYADGKIKSKEVEADNVYGKSLYLDYPKAGDKKENVADLIKTNADNIAQNKKDITANKKEINSLKNRVSTAETNIQINADAIEELRKLLLPVGSIIMYSGTAAIPQNWSICDGTNGTPNLVGKFIKAGSTSGITGGSNSVTLNIGNLPSHSHDISITTSNNSQISDSIKSKLIPAYDEFYEEVFDKGGDKNYTLQSGFENKGDKGLVGIKVSDLLGGTITSTASNTGGNERFDIQPEFYTLIFIMKIK